MALHLPIESCDFLANRSGDFSNDAWHRYLAMKLQKGVPKLVRHDHPRIPRNLAKVNLTRHPLLLGTAPASPACRVALSSAAARPREIAPSTAHDPRRMRSR